MLFVSVLSNLLVLQRIFTEVLNYPFLYLSVFVHSLSYFFVLPWVFAGVQNDIFLPLSVFVLSLSYFFVIAGVFAGAPRNLLVLPVVFFLLPKYLLVPQKTNLVFRGTFKCPLEHFFKKWVYYSGAGLCFPRPGKRCFKSSCMACVPGTLERLAPLIEW